MHGVATCAGSRRRPEAPDPGGPPLALTLGGLGVLAQVGYPLTPAGTARSGLTIGTVVVLFLAGVAHAGEVRGARFAATLVAVTGGVGWLAEAVGTRTGWPFGAYAYADSLGPTLLGVPVVIPLAWTMMAYPALVVADRLTAGPRSGPLVAGYALASWDLFLDPQMVAAGHWRWADPAPALPGVPGVPVGNYLGWLLAATAMMALLWRLLPADPAWRPDDRLPLALFLWTYASSVLANVTFFGRPAVALVGGIGMGVVGLPLAWQLLRQRFRQQPAWQLRRPQQPPQRPSRRPSVR